MQTKTNTKPRRTILEIGEMVQTPWGYDDDGFPVGPNEAEVDHEVDAIEYKLMMADLTARHGGLV